MTTLGRAVLRLEADASNLNQQMEQAKRTTEQRFGQISRTAGVALAGIGAGITAIGALSARAAIDFESSFAGVRKTVEATEGQFAELSQGLRDLAKEIPVNVNELNRVAEAAGQLGIQRENILAFTETMAQLGVTTNLTAEEAATALARFSNLTGTAPEDVSRLGSAIVALGNNSATTEAEIVNMSLRLASAGKEAGFTEAQTLALAATLSSLGVRAELGGTNTSKAILEINSAVLEAGGSLRDFADVAGVSAEAFATAWKDDAQGALELLLTGLNDVRESGGDLAGVLEGLGFTGTEMTRVFLALIEGQDQLRESTNLATDAWRENNALTEEARKRFETTAAQLAIAQQRLNDVSIIIGGALLPHLSTLAELVGNIVSPIGEWLQQNERLANILVPLAGTVGLLSLALGGVLFVLPQLAAGFALLRGAVRAANVETGVSAGILNGHRIAMVASTVATRAATVATRAFGVATKIALGPIGLAAVAIGLVAGAVATFAIKARDAKRDSAGLDQNIAGIGDASRQAAPGVDVLTASLDRLNATQLEQRRLALQADVDELDKRLAGQFGGGSDEQIRQRRASVELLRDEIQGELDLVQVRLDQQKVTEEVARAVDDLTSARRILDDENQRAKRTDEELERLARQAAVAEETLRRHLGDRADEAIRAADAQGDLGRETRTTTGAVNEQGNAFVTTTDKVETYADRLAKARQALEDARIGAAEAIRIQNDLGASYGDLAEWTDELAPSVDELADSLDRQAEAARVAAERVRELRAANREFEAARLADAGISRGDLAVAGSEFAQLSAGERAALLQEAEELGIDPVELLARNRQLEQADAEHFREGLQQAGKFNADLIDEDDARTQALLKAQEEYRAEALRQEKLGNKELFDEAVVNAIRTAEELQTIQGAVNQERENAAFKLGDDLVAVESDTGDRLAVELQVYLDELATLQGEKDGERYADALARTSAFVNSNVKALRQMNIAIGNILSENNRGGGSRSGVRDGIATFVETTTDAAGWTLSRTTTDDFDGNRHTTVTGTRSDGSTFQTDDETFESVEQENRGLAAGGIARARPGGVSAILAEAGDDELVAPLTPPVLGEIGKGIFSSIRMSDILPRPISTMMPTIAPLAPQTGGIGRAGGGDLYITINAENVYGENVTELVQEQIQKAHRRGWVGS